MEPVTEGAHVPRRESNVTNGGRERRLTILWGKGDKLGPGKERKEQK